MTTNRLTAGALTAYAVLLVVFLFAPVITVVVFSFDERGLGILPIEGLTTRWYQEFFQNPAMVAAAKRSAYVAAATAAIAVTIGTLASFALVRHRVRGSTALTGFIVLPIVLPPLLLGISLLSFFDRIGFRLSLWTVVVAHVLITLPFVVLTINARLASLDPSLEEVADTLGATRWQAFRHVTFPLIRTSVVGSALLVVALSVDEFVVTFFTAGSDQTLPVVIWAQMRAGVSPVVNAVSTLMLTATLLLVLVVRRLTEVRVR